METSPSRHRRERLLVAFAVLVAVLMLLALRRCGDRSVARSRAAATAQPVARLAADAESRGASVLPEPNGTSATTETATFRMQALTFVMSKSALRLQQAATVAGRVKAPPRSVAPNRIEFKAFDAQGRVVFEGAFDHPLHRLEEYENPDRPGELRRIERELEEGAFQLRLPADAGAVRVSFSEILAGAGQEIHRPIGEYTLP